MTHPSTHQLPEMASLIGLIEEIGDRVKANRSMGIGDESTDLSIREQFRDRLFDALLSDIPLPEITSELQARIERERKETRNAIIRESIPALPATRMTPPKMTQAHVRFIEENLLVEEPGEMELYKEIAAFIQSSLSSDPESDLLSRRVDADIDRKTPQQLGEERRAREKMIADAFDSLPAEKKIEIAQQMKLVGKIRRFVPSDSGARE
jgi:hypothetical protein